MNPNDSNDVYAAACIERFHERHRVLDVIRRGAEDDAPPPEERLLGADFCRPFAATANDYSLDVPTIAETIATARGMLSARARAGLDAQPADERGRTAHAVATGAYLAEWDRHLSQGQPWPDVIEGTP